MFDVIKLMLLSAYYYGKLVGVLNFEMDLKAGRAVLTTRSSIYAALMNVTTISILPFLSTSQLMQTFLSKSSGLHKYVFNVMVGGRILCVIVTLSVSWWRRQRILRIINALIGLTRENPRVKRMWRRAVVSKFFSLIFIQCTQVLMSLVIFWHSMTLRLVISLLALFTISELGNVLISHYYFALLTIHGHYVLLNAELRMLLGKISFLEFEHGKGVFAIKCCALADRIDCIARTQFQLRALVECINNISGFQTLFTTVTMYAASVIAIYFTFSELPGTPLTVSWNSWQVSTLFFTEYVLFSIDTCITINVMYSVLDQHKEMMRILTQSTVFAPGLDKRLELVLESFKLQLAANPLELSVLGLYTVEKPRAIILLSSILTSSLLFIQYDLQHS